MKMKLSLALVPLLVASVFSLPIEVSYEGNRVGKLDVSTKEAKTNIDLDKSKKFISLLLYDSHPTVTKRDDSQTFSGKEIAVIWCSIFGGAVGIVGLIALVCYASDHYNRRRNNLRAAALASSNTAPKATIAPSYQLNEIQPSDNETLKKEGRNMAFFKMHYGSSDSALNASANYLTGTSKKHFVVTFPMRTVAILKVLFQENHFFSTGVSKTIGAEYLAFIKDNTNALKMIDRYSSCEKFINYFDDPNLQETGTSQSIVSRFNDECIVCRDEFKAMDAVFVLPSCGHYFHPVCCEQWLTRSRGTCPVCMKLAFTGGELEDGIRRYDTVGKVLERYNAVDEIEREFWEHVKELKEGVDDITNSAEVVSDHTDSLDDSSDVTTSTDVASDVTNSTDAASDVTMTVD